jgi:formylmethanofuran dehydrogenase subunit C
VSALTFTMRDAPRQRVDLSPLTPSALSERAREDIGNIPLWCGNRQLAAHELFDIAGDDANLVTFAGELDRCDRIGTGMTAGRIVVAGNCGAYLGAKMAGGEIEARGDCGIFAASQMKAGMIRIAGDAGDFLAAAPAGERRGMMGGTVIVAGDAGDRAGDFMRRGTLLIEGDVGDYCASRMLAGTIAIAGNVGSRAGYAMRRGTLLLFRQPKELLPTFADCGAHPLGFLTLLRQSWRILGGAFADLGERGVSVRRFMGDAANGGKGEILVWS